MPSNLLMYSKMTLTFWSSSMGSIVPEWVHCTNSRSVLPHYKSFIFPMLFWPKSCKFALMRSKPVLKIGLGHRSRGYIVKGSLGLPTMPMENYPETCLFCMYGLW